MKHYQKYSYTRRMVKMVGFVYVIADQHERIKVGFTMNMYHRARQFQTGNGDKLLVALLLEGATQRDEYAIKKELQPWRVDRTDGNRSEWFRNHPEVWYRIKKFAKVMNLKKVVLLPDQLEMFTD